MRTLSFGGMLQLWEQSECRTGPAGLADLKLFVDGGDRLLEHPPVRGRGGPREVGRRPRARKAEAVGAFFLCLVGGAQLRRGRTAPRRFLLLELHHLGLEPSGHLSPPPIIKLHGTPS